MRLQCGGPLARSAPTTPASRASSPWAAAPSDPPTDTLIQWRAHITFRLSFFSTLDFFGLLLFVVVASGRGHKKKDKTKDEKPKSFFFSHKSLTKAQKETKKREKKINDKEEG